MSMIGKIKQGISKRERKNQSKSKAQGFLEFALVLPLLLLLIFGVIEFGRMLFIYSAVFTATREAARFGSAAGKVDGTPRYNDCAGIRARAIEIGSIAGLRDEDISIRYDSGPGTPILLGSSCPYNEEEGKVKVREGYHRIIVEINTDFTPMIPLVNVPPAVIHSRSARTIMSDISVKVDITPIPTAAQNAMYINSLSGTSSSNETTWTATVTIHMKDEYGNDLEGVTVNYFRFSEQSTGLLETVTCQTGYSGTCSVQDNYGTEILSVDYTVDTNTLYHPSHYHDQKLDKVSEPKITINKP
jgi:hypothetical protein